MADDVSRVAMLDAAWEIIVEAFGLAESREPPSQRASVKLFEPLKTADVARRAGLSTGAFYNRWPTRDDFLDDFLDYALSIDRYPGTGFLFDVFATVAEKDFPEMLTALTAANLREVEGDPTHAIQRYLWAFCREREDVAVRLQTLNREMQLRVIPFYEAMLAFLGREVRPPFTMESGALLMNVITEGLIEKRGPGGEDAPPVELLAWALMAIVPAMTMAVGDERDLNEYVMEELAVGSRK